MTILVIKKNGKDLKREIWNPIIPRRPRVMPLAKDTVVLDLTPVRFQDPKPEETLELESIGSDISCEGSMKITETYVKLETKYSEETLNTGNAELQEPNAKPDLENIKKKITTEPGKAHHTVISEYFDIKKE